MAELPYKGQMMEWTGRMGLRALQWTETCYGNEMDLIDLIVDVAFSTVGARMSFDQTAVSSISWIGISALGLVRQWNGP